MNNVINKISLALLFAIIMFVSVGVHAQVPPQVPEPEIYSYLREELIQGDVCFNPDEKQTTISYYIVWDLESIYPIDDNTSTEGYWAGPSVTITSTSTPGMLAPIAYYGEAPLTQVIGCLAEVQIEAIREEKNNENWQVTANFVYPGNTSGAIVSNDSTLADLPTVEVLSKPSLVSVQKASNTKDPINIATGEMFIDTVDFSILSQGPDLVLARGFRSQSTFSGLFGYGWRTTMDVNLTEDVDGNIVIYDTQGTGSYFVSNGDGTYQPSYGNYSQITKNLDDTYTIVNKYGATIDYNSSGRITAVTDRNGNALQFVFNPGVTDGTYIEDATGRKIILTLDPSNRIIQAEDPAGNIYGYEYDIDGNLTIITNPENYDTVYTYNIDRNIIEMTNVNGNKTYFGYDTQDRAIMNSQENDLNKETLSFQPDNTTVVTDALNNQTTYVFNDYGLEISRTDALTGTVTTTWDRSMNKTSVTDELGNTTTFYYDLEGNLRKVKDADDKVTSFKYTSEYNLISQMTDSLGNTTSYEYDDNGNLLSVTDPLGNSSKMTYDSAGNVLNIENASGNVTTFLYDTYGYPINITDAEQNQTVNVYDVNGNVTSTTTPKNEQTTFTYDEFNRVEMITYPDTSTVTYVYDAFGNQASVTDNVGTTTNYAYNDGEMLSIITDPLLKTTTYLYNNNGQVSSITDRNNNTTAYAYTAKDQLGTITYSDVSTVGFTYDLAGKVQTVTESTGTTSFNYDDLSRLTDQTDLNGFTVGYEYDDASNVTKVIYPGMSKEVVYTYDELSRIKTVTTWTNHVATYNYNEDGSLKSVENFNGIEANYSYDKASRLEFLDVQKTDGTSIARYQYGLDGNGNRTEVTKTEPLIVDPATSSKTFTYNAKKNRLLSAGADSFTYDDEGQLATKMGTSYTFDYEHRLTGIGATSQFSYNAAGSRLKAVRSSVTTKYIYDAAGNLLAEADDNDVIQKYYIYGSGLLAMITPTGDVYTYNYDGGGNTVSITDQSQVVQNSYSYTPFGLITSESENITNPFKFSGQYGIMCEGNDVYFMRRRYYDASIGRFISEDPSGFVDGPNKYRYARNNPANYVDPSGNIPLPLVTGAIGAVAGGVGNAVSQIIANGGTNNFNWGEVGVATGVGFGAGAAAPFVATSAVGATLLGGGANLAQYSLTQAVNKDAITAQGLGISLGTGLLGGYVAGSISGGSSRLFDTTGRFMNASFARSLNNDIAVQANTAASNVLRNMLGGIISNLNGSTDAANTNPNMCKESACF